MVKIAYIVPTTSKGFKGKFLNQTLLLTTTIPTFLQTYSKEHEYKFFIGIDKNDILYDKDEPKQYIIDKLDSNNIQTEFIVYENIEKGHLTKMWNILFKHAYDQNYEYFFQGGDDVEFITENWINDCIEVLKKNDNIGVTGPNNCIMRNQIYINSLLTQTFVSRKHMEIFGYYFPEEIKNWFCDDWLSSIYKIIGKYYMLVKHKCVNRGGKERYDIKFETDYFKYVNRDLNRIKIKYNFNVNVDTIKNIKLYDEKRLNKVNNKKGLNFKI